MPRKNRQDAGSSPSYWKPPVVSKLAKSVATQEPKATGGDPVYFERQVQLPSKKSAIWRGWDDNMPPEYRRCPRCLAGDGEKHAPKCSKPDLKKIWHCPSCSVAIGKRHEFYCPRIAYNQSVYDQSAYSDDTFLARCGFTSQVWDGEGHPTRMARRIGLYQFCQKMSRMKIQVNEPWRVPILTKAEREELKKLSGKDIPF